MTDNTDAISSPETLPTRDESIRKRERFLRRCGGAVAQLGLSSVFSDLQTISTSLTPAYDSDCQPVEVDLDITMAIGPYGPQTPKTLLSTYSIKDTLQNISRSISTDTQQPSEAGSPEEAMQNARAYIEQRVTWLGTWFTGAENRLVRTVASACRRLNIKATSDEIEESVREAVVALMSTDPRVWPSESDTLRHHIVRAALNRVSAWAQRRITWEDTFDSGDFGKSEVIFESVSRTEPHQHAYMFAAQAMDAVRRLPILQQRLAVLLAEGATIGECAKELGLTLPDVMREHQRLKGLIERILEDARQERVEGREHPYPVVGAEAVRAKVDCDLRWRSLASAPRDGTWILVWNSESFVPQRARVTKRGRIMTGEWETEVRAEKWMPMPSSAQMYALWKKRTAALTLANS